MPPAAGSPGLGLLAYNVPAKINQITDGLSKTIVYAESGGRPYLYRGGQTDRIVPGKARERRRLVPACQRHQHRRLQRRWFNRRRNLCHQLHQRHRNGQHVSTSVLQFGGNERTLCVSSGRCQFLHGRRLRAVDQFGHQHPRVREAGHANWIGEISAATMSSVHAVANDRGGQKGLRFPSPAAMAADYGSLLCGR